MKRKQKIKKYEMKTKEQIEIVLRKNSLWEKLEGMLPFFCTRKIGYPRNE